MFGYEQSIWHHARFARTEWAAKEEVSETIAAAVLLICETRPVHEVVAKLTAVEFERVFDIVRRSPDHFPSGTLAALNELRLGCLVSCGKCCSKKQPPQMRSKSSAARHSICRRCLTEAQTILAPALEGFSPTPEFSEIVEAQALLAALV